MVVGDEIRVSLCFKKGRRGSCVIPFIGLIFFHISIGQELDFIELLYCCQYSVLYILVMYLHAVRDSLRFMLSEVDMVF